MPYENKEQLGLVGVVSDISSDVMERGYGLSSGIGSTLFAKLICVFVPVCVRRVAFLVFKHETNKAIYKINIKQDVCERERLWHLDT